MNVTLLRRCATTAAIVGSVGALGVGQAAAQSSTPVQPTTTHAVTTSAPTQLTVTDARTGFRYTFTKVQTQQLYDFAKAGGKIAAKAGCEALLGPEAAPLCGPATEFIVEAIATPFDPAGRCLQLYAFTEDPLPIGAKYVDC